jgi:hypothetical protein
MLLWSGPWQRPTPPPAMPSDGRTSCSYFFDQPDAGGPTAPHQNEFIGHESELARLQSSWESVAEGRHRLLWIAGDAGIGKSTLTGSIKTIVCKPSLTRLECTPLFAVNRMQTSRTAKPGRCQPCVSRFS